MEAVFDALRDDPSREDLLRELKEYYEGGQWLRDYEMDEAGLLPPDLKRGVLSQDGVYDLLERCDNEEKRGTDMSFTYIKTGRSPLAFRLKDLNVFFTDQGCMKTIEAVLDADGKIRNFPGMEADGRWEKKQNIGIPRDVRFEAQFIALADGRTLMKWMTQPSGWEWMDDDGFGFSGDSSIMLYSVLDADGNFTMPFALYSIDGQRYCREFD